MVQILPAIPSFGERLGAGLGGGISSGIKQKYAELAEAKAQEREFSKKLDLEKAKQKAKYEERGNYLKENFPQMFSKEKPKFSELASLAAQERGQSKRPQDMMQEQETPDSNSDQMPHSSEELLRLSAIEPGMANLLEQQNKDYLKQKHHQDLLKEGKRKEARKEELKFHDESKNYDEELLSKYKKSVDQDVAIDQIEKSIATGNVQPWKIGNLFKGTGTFGDKIADAFLSKDQASINAVIPYLIEGWKDVFGVRLSDADLAIIQDKLPSISKDPEANKAILNIFRKYSKLAKMRYEIGKKVKEDNKGMRPLGYADKVEEEYARLNKPVKIRNPRTGNIVDIPSHDVSNAIKAGGELVEEKGER